MKLYELITPVKHQSPLSARNLGKIHHEVSDRRPHDSEKPPGYLPSIVKSKNITKMNQGLYGDVYHHKNKPHEVIKVGGNPNDSYSKYIEAVSELSSSNPYLPRVYKHKKYGKELYTMEIEKLMPLKDLNIKEIQSILIRLDPKYDTKRFEYQYGEDDIVRAVNRYFWNPEDSKNMDPLFKQAADIITRIEMEHRVAFRDIHKENMMARRTPHGVQLVITDPLGG